jgi:hypothetical protein
MTLDAITPYPTGRLFWGGVVPGTSCLWSLDIQCLRRLRCVPEGRLESRPAIYRRCWCLESDLVPEGRSKLGLAMADTSLR